MIYDKKQDIVEFVREREEARANPWFRGSEHYKMLWDSGLLIPDMTTLRVYFMGGMGIDFIYEVKSRDEVEGTGWERATFYSPKGVFSVEDVLDLEERTFEADPLKLEVLYPDLFQQE